MRCSTAVGWPLVSHVGPRFARVRRAARRDTRRSARASRAPDGVTTLQTPPAGAALEVVAGLVDGHTLTLDGARRGAPPAIVLKSRGGMVLVPAGANPMSPDRWTAAVELDQTLAKDAGPWRVYLRGQGPDAPVAYAGATAWQVAPLWVRAARLFNLTSHAGLLVIEPVAPQPGAVLAGAHSGPGHLSALIRVDPGMVVVGAELLAPRDHGPSIPLRVLPSELPEHHRLSVPVASLLAAPADKQTFGLRVLDADGRRLRVRHAHDDLPEVRVGPAFSWTWMATPAGQVRRARFYITVGGSLGVALDALGGDR